MAGGRGRREPGRRDPPDADRQGRRRRRRARLPVARRRQARGAAGAAASPRRAPRGRSRARHARPGSRRRAVERGGPQVTCARLVPARVEARAVGRGRFPWTFGPLTLRLLLLGLLLLVPVWIDRRAIAVVIVWDAIVLAAWAMDLLRLPRPDAVIVSRSWTAPVTLGVPQNVRLDPRNGGGAGR